MIRTGVSLVAAATGAVFLVSAAPAPAAAPTAAAPVQAALPPMPAGVASRGQSVFMRCQSCHSLTDNRVGPRLRGVVGRVAGKEAGYSYSPALAGQTFTWDAARLNRWLSGPQTVVPGTKMRFMVADPQQRADVIAYLATQGR